MIEQIGNYLTTSFAKEHADDVFLFTANNVVAKVNNTLHADHKLVMGAGAAKSFLQLFPMSDYLFADRIAAIPRYGCFTVKYTNTRMSYRMPEFIGAFQTKYHWRDPSSLELIEYSTNKLKEMAERNPHFTYHLNYPGIGLGGLDINKVRETISILPDNVNIWRLENNERITHNIPR